MRAVILQVFLDLERGLLEVDGVLESSECSYTQNPAVVGLTSSATLNTHVASIPCADSTSLCRGE